MEKEKLSPTKILSKKEPEKRLLLSLKRRAGRARSGRITVRHKGGGVKRRYRLIDFGQEKLGIRARVLFLEYDPYRTAFIMLLEYEDGEKRYRLAPDNIKVGSELICDKKAEIKIGNRTQLKDIPVGVMVYNIELIPGEGGKLARSAGNTVKVLAQEGKYTHLQMPSGEIRMVPQDCYATIGMVSHPEWKYETIGKAGRVRLRGKRPTVRGSAMNPCDHPHGGGEGRTPIGLKHPKTPWGKPARGVKTRRKRWTNKYIIQRRNYGKVN